MDHNSATTRFLWLSLGLSLSCILATLLFSTSASLHQLKAVRFSKEYAWPQRLQAITQTVTQVVRHESSKLPPWIPLWGIHKPTGLIDARLPTAEELEKDARTLLPLLEELKRHRFFRIFKADLSKECPFWARREMCTDGSACHICECDDHQVPQVWREKPVENFVDRNHYETEEVEPWGGGATSSFHSTALHVGRPPAMVSREGFGHINGLPSVSDEPSTRATYVDLTLNRPGYTAYKGRNIWRLIYLENCMGTSDNPLEHPENVSHANECTEEEAFHKIISGMQTVIMVLASEYNEPTQSATERIRQIEEMKTRGVILDMETFRSQYKPNMQLFKQRVAPYGEWLQNLYFSFGVLLRTLCHISPILETCTCNTGKPQDDLMAQHKLRELLAIPFATCRGDYVDAPLFNRKQHVALRQFQNISRIMDCLECEKCRLHGKVKILALQLALRASGKDARVRSVERNEVIALINALDYYADAIASIQRFQQRLSRYRLLWASTCVATTGIALFMIVAVASSSRQLREDMSESVHGSEFGDSASTAADTAPPGTSPRLTKTDLSSGPRMRKRKCLPS